MDRQRRIEIFLQAAHRLAVTRLRAEPGRIGEVRALLQESGLEKHTQKRDMLMNTLGLSYGYANSLVHYALGTDGQTAAEASGASTEDVLSQIYTGAKESLRPIHEKFMEELNAFGEFEEAPKKGYIAYRRKKQFAMLGPATNTRVELGLNMKDVPGTDRLLAQAPGGMCQYKVKITSADEIDAELMGWVRTAFDSAG